MSDYFKASNPIAAFFVLYGMTLCYFGAYSPESVPLYLLGPLKDVYVFLSITRPEFMYWIFHSAAIVHVLEGLATIFITSKKGITQPMARLKWFIQTTLLGVFSLKNLIAYKPVKKDE